MTELYVRLVGSKGRSFAELFERVRVHSHVHFAAKQTLMAENGYPATAEHRAEHQRLLGDLQRFGGRCHCPRNIFPSPVFIQVDTPRTTARSPSHEQASRRPDLDRRRPDPRARDRPDPRYA